MKKNLSVLLILFSILLSAQIYILPHDKTDLADNDLKGNVKYALIKNWDLIVRNDSIINGSCTSKKEAFFRKDGQYGRYDYYDENDKVKSTKSFTYNTEGNIVGTIYLLDNKESKNNYFYNTENQLIEISYSYENQLWRSDKYSYDGNKLKKITKKFLEEKDVKYGGSILYLWDGQSRMASEYFFDVEGQRTSNRDYSYDGNGNIVLIDEKKSGDILSSKSEFFYNSKNQKIKETYLYKGKGDIYITLYTYDSYGNVTMKEAQKGSQEPTISKSRYTYDSNGNWLTKLTEDEDKEYELIERKIEYY